MSQTNTLKYPVLGKLSPTQFLKRYWQKKPLLIRSAFDPFPDVISPDELAGMCCDPQIESRLILERGGKIPWELRKGPFKPSMFKKLPKTHWTFLVNGVDRFVPGVHDLLDQFSFIPFWRIDDVMMSYAVDQGNVGAHVDNYDVFLVQVAGRREWRIEDKAVLGDDFVPDLPIRLLKRFKPSHTWILEPGDMLYLPPRFAHHGIAQGTDCVTMSVGFRAPSMADLVNSVSSAALSRVDENVRYTDPELSLQHPGAITPKTLEKVQALIQKEIFNPAGFSDWFGRFVTESYADVEFPAPRKPLPSTTVKKLLKSASSIARVEGARLAFIEDSRRAIRLFANGSVLKLEGEAAELGKLLASRISLSSSQLKPFSGASSVSLLGELFARGILAAVP
jgi:50S ribosomal protein L16 3-hydroxylase